MQGSPATAHASATLAEDRLLRPDQAAWYLNVKASWVYEAARTGLEFPRSCGVLSTCDASVAGGMDWNAEIEAAVPGGSPA